MLERRAPAAKPDGTELRTGERDELRLLARICQRDLTAFEALYRLYHPRLARFLERMTRRPALNEELLNDTMLVVWHRAERFNGGSKVSTWIFAIAYRKALKALQQWDEPVEDTIDQRVDTDAGPELLLSQGQTHSHLVAALAQLSTEQRAVVELAYFQGMAYREIADIVDCPAETVKTRMFYARRRLKALLSGRLEDWV